MRGQSPEIVRPVPTRETPEMARSRTSVGINNTLAVRHGSQSPAIVALNTPAVVRDVINALAAEIPYLDPADMLLVEQTARLPTRIRLIEDHLDRLGGSLIDSRGRQRGCARLYVTLQTQLRACLAQLGVGPAVRASMGVGIAALRSAEAAARAQQRLRDKYAPKETA